MDDITLEPVEQVDFGIALDPEQEGIVLAWIGDTCGDCGGPIHDDDTPVLEMTWMEALRVGFVMIKAGQVAAQRAEVEFETLQTVAAKAILAANEHPQVPGDQE